MQTQIYRYDKDTDTDTDAYAVTDICNTDTHTDTDTETDTMRQGHPTASECWKVINANRRFLMAGYKAGMLCVHILP